MQIILKQKDIEQALTLYLRDQGINLTNKNLSVSWTAGRKESGITAEIDIEEIPESSKNNSIPITNRRVAQSESEEVVSVPTTSTKALADDEPNNQFRPDDDEPAFEAEQSTQPTKATTSRVSLFS